MSKKRKIANIASFDKNQTTTTTTTTIGDSHYIVANVPDFDIVVSEFALKSRYYIHFRKSTLGKD